MVPQDRYAGIYSWLYIPLIHDALDVNENVVRRVYDGAGFVPFDVWEAMVATIALNF
jgi:hypothetical protein